MNTYTLNEILKIIEKLKPKDEVKIFYFLPHTYGAYYNKYRLHKSETHFYSSIITPYFVSIQRVSNDKFYHIAGTLFDASNNKFLTESEIEKKTRSEYAAVPYLKLGEIVHNSLRQSDEYYINMLSLMSTYKDLLGAKEDLASAFNNTLRAMDNIINVLENQHPEYIL